MMSVIPLNNLVPLAARRSLWFVMIVGLLLLVVICWVDVITGPNIEVTLYYLIPVCFVVWFGNRTMGFVMAVASAGAALLALPWDAGFRSDIAYTNTATRLIFFFMVVAFLSAWKSAGSRLEAMVEARTAELKAESAEHARARRAIRDLAAQLAAAEDAERRRLAYDIHDALGQMLSAVKLNISTALSFFSAEESEKSPLARRLAETMRFIDELIRQTRTLVFDLHPAMLDDLGLLPTLQWYSREFGKQTGVDVTVSEQGTARVPGQATTHFLFRAIKELLNNALNHGRAGEIIIALHWQNDILRIVIDDDGRGFDSVAVLDAQPRRGLGLAAIRERMAALGGRLQVESRADEGTRVILEAALDAPALSTGGTGSAGGRGS